MVEQTKVKPPESVLQLVAATYIYSTVTLNREPHGHLRWADGKIAPKN